MTAAGGDGDLPVAGRAPGNRAHVLSVFLAQPFEVERGIGALARCNQIGARNRKWQPGLFLITGQDHLDIGALQRSGLVHGAQRGEHRDHPALVIGRARTLDLVSADPLEFLERMVKLEHRIKVPDQQQPLGAFLALMFGNEMSGAANRGLIDPAHGKAQSLEFGHQHVVNGSHALEIAGPAVLVDQLFQQIKVARLLGIDSGDHRLLSLVGRRSEDRRGQDGGGDQRDGR